ncbi:Rossmann-like and DUF2520 domain-containing protein [Frankia canadensis]|uniref:Rossmann-like and DUF2520 domain-containing protein n=1 Tax=Frankia canadensis TaxID=1836972 RepID=UPI003C2CD08B
MGGADGGGTAYPGPGEPAAPAPPAGPAARRSPAARPSLGLVGAGRAGTAVAAALAAVGHPVVAVVTRSEEGRARAAARFPAARTGPVASVAARLRAADVLLVAVPDDAIATVTAELVAVGAVRAGQLLAHLSGRHGLGVLRTGGGSRAALAAIHPIMTLPGGEPGPRVFEGVPFGITADPAAADRARSLATAVGGVPLTVADDSRDLYHAALVLGGNFLTSLAVAARDALTAAGVTDPAVALGPLLRASLDNALAAGWPAATGPVRRGDVGTVRAHLEALTAVDPAVAEVYRALARFTARELAGAGLLPPAGRSGLDAALAGPTGSTRDPA